MDDPLLFGSSDYWLMFAHLIFGRGMDFLSTWVATPNLVLEGNPIAKRLGWKLGAVVNLGLCFTFAMWPVTSIIICTTSVLVAARNLQQAWLMRTMGEESYRFWHVQRMFEAKLPFYVFCLLGQTLLIGLVGGALVYFSELAELAPGAGPTVMIVPFAIGVGIVGYAITVLFYTLLSVWRIRRSMR
ncbi:MAG: hypothetical protein JWM68_3815 [Verrucomicrobiales bacterium]|nr:hypothetical protein [Verrucomicrobiales bacterium]